MSPRDICTLSLHDALPISPWQAGASTAHRTKGSSRNRGRGLTGSRSSSGGIRGGDAGRKMETVNPRPRFLRSEEHTSELQSRQNLVCRLPLEKKKNKKQ